MRMQFWYVNLTLFLTDVTTVKDIMSVNMLVCISTGLRELLILITWDNSCSCPPHINTDWKVLGSTQTPQSTCRHPFA